MSKATENSKAQPIQSRSRETYEAILRCAGELLAEAGFEKLTTNLICKKAKLTPPALYRYFPDKYAVLKELGDRLMKAQDDIVFDWIAEGGLEPKSEQEMVEASVDLQRRVVKLTRAFPGSYSILRALRAVPTLQQSRIESRNKVAEQFRLSMQPNLPGIPEERLRLVMRLMVELKYAATEMVIEEGDDLLDVTSESARMFYLYFKRLENQAARDP